MRTLKKVGLDLLLIALLLVVALFLGVISNMANKDCVTCGARITSTFSFASVLALQPVVWVSGLTYGTRTLIWLCALVAGVLVYVVLEVAGLALLSAGNLSAAVNVGLFANVAGVVTALALSFGWVRSKYRRMNLPSTSPANHS